MKLSRLAIQIIKGGDADFKARMASALNVSLNTLYRYISENDDTMTKASGMEFLRKETGLGDEQLLEREVIESETTK